ncbi:hypothetical protein MRX96_017962 [Rhipicephalus microplus]
MTSTYRVRTVPTRTVTTVRRQVIDDDGDFFDFPKARAGASEFTTVRHRVTPGGGVVTTTTTTTTTPRRVIRDVSLDGMDADPFFARDVSRPSRTKDLEEFKVSFDIGLHFKPDDLSVKTRAGMVFITAKRTDGNITRESPRNLSSRYTSNIYERHVPVRMSLY